MFRKWTVLLVLVSVLLLVLIGCSAEPQVVEVTRIITDTVTELVEVEGTPQLVEVEVTRIVTEVEQREVIATPAPVDRTGAWVDTVIVVEEPSADVAVRRLAVGDIDIYAFQVAEAPVFAQIQAQPELTYARSYGSYDELTLNPSGPILEGSRLNPFAVPRIREAMNWLIDRDYIAEEISGGLATPRYLPINSGFPDYARYVDVARALEARYAHDPARALEVIGLEMEALGAEQVNGQWQYGGEPVELIVLIRTEDERLAIGDYVSNLLEDAGFSVVRDYRTAAEAAPIWQQSDPAEGRFHIYTGGWITTIVSRDDGANFDFFYTPRGLAIPLWQAYTPTAEFDEVSDRLARNDFASLDERQELFTKALELAMEDSARIWLIDEQSVSPYRSDVSVSSDLAGSISGSWLWSRTLRQTNEVGGSMTIAMPSILTQPWNPLDGSNWIYDQMLIRGLGDNDLMPDPYTGLYWPQLLDHAEVFIKEGLPVSKSLDWVSLEFVSENEVPEDAWIDWDATEQRFITVGEQHPEGLTANRKVILHYSADLFERKWHDGSTFSLADMVMAMILQFDRSSEGSAVYDAARAPSAESFRSHFKGTLIVSEDPLVLEFYSDQYFLDAEWNVAFLNNDYTASWYPYYARGEGAWHNLTLGLLAEAGGEAAFSASRAESLNVEQLSYIAGPTIEILLAQLEEALAEGYIPYAPTLGQYISAEEAQARYENLQEWHRRRGHFWIGTGAFFLERAFPVEGTVILQRNPDFPDPADKWDRFSAPAVAEVEIDGPGRVTTGAEAIYDVFITFAGEPYAVADMAEVKYLVFDATGELVHIGEAEAVEDGLWQITLSAELIDQLGAGANLLEVVAVSHRVAIPSADSLPFVTAP